jgi:hypothetical protein
MGCSSSEQLTINDTEFLPGSYEGMRILPISLSKEKYFKNSMNFSKLQLNPEIESFLLDINISNEENLNILIDNIYSKFFSEFQKLDMTREDLKEIILIKVFEKSIPDVMNYKTFIFKNLLSCLIDLNENENNIKINENIPNNFLLASQRYFPNLQKYVEIKIVNEINSDLKLMKYYFENLKFNPKFEINLMKVNIDDDFNKDEMNLINVSQLIFIKKHLNGLALCFDAKRNDFIIKNSMKFIFNAINLNENLNAFCFIGKYYNEKYTLNNELKNSLFNVIKSDKFFSLVISKIVFNEDEIKDLISLLNNLKKLKFLIVDFQNLNNSLLESFINLCKVNNKLMYCFISGGELNDINNLGLEKEIKVKNSNFKNFIYIKKLSLFYD